MGGRGALGRGRDHRYGGRIGPHRLGHQAPAELARTSSWTRSGGSELMLGSRHRRLRVGRGYATVDLVRTCAVVVDLGGLHHEWRQAEEPPQGVDLGIARPDLRHNGGRCRPRGGGRNADHLRFERRGPWPVADWWPDGGGREPAHRCRAGAECEAERSPETGDGASQATDAHSGQRRSAVDAEARTDACGDRRAEAGRLR